MNSFPTFATDVIGGIQSFQFAPEYTIDSIIDGVVTFKSGYNWLGGLSHHMKSQLSIKPSKNKSGTVYNSKYQGFYPGITADSIYYFDSLLNYKYAVLIQDYDGRVYLLQNARFMHDFDSGQPNSDKGINFYFSSISNIHPAIS